MRRSYSFSPKRKTGFTLVELLVVIGIIALLISILLPSLNKAREAGRRVKCLSNMRQIVMAMNMFAQDSQGFMPGRGSGTKYIPQKSGNSAWGSVPPGEKPVDTADWICWPRVIDPVTGTPTGNGANTSGDGNITFSALAKYLGSKSKVHSTSTEANQVSQQLESLLRCPSDKLEQRPQATATATPTSVYRYSYAANNNYMMPVSKSAPGTSGVPAAVLNGLNPNTKPEVRSDGNFNGKLASIKNTGDKILLICEDEMTVTFPTYKSQPWALANAAPNIPNLLASRHDGTMTKTGSNAVAGSGGLPINSRGNVVMADGHGEFISRKEAISQKHSGNPYRDPQPGEIAGW